MCQQCAATAGTSIAALKLYQVVESVPGTRSSRERTSEEEEVVVVITCTVIIIIRGFLKPVKIPNINFAEH